MPLNNDIVAKIGLSGMSGPFMREYIDEYQSRMRLCKATHYWKFNTKMKMKMIKRIIKTAGLL